MRVAEIMTPDPIVLHGRDRLDRAEREMEASMCRHIPVVDQHGLLVGMVSHEDVRSAPDLALRLSDVMRTDMKTVAPETAAHEAAYLLLHHRLDCLPVTEKNGRIVGIVTESDFVRVAYRLLGGVVPLDQMEREDRES